MEITRGEYTFVGSNGEKSAEFYDTCMKIHDGVEDKDPELYRKIVWESGHKFGSRVIGPHYASTKDGAFEGVRAREAAEYADHAQDQIYKSLPIVGRRIALRAAMEKVILDTEKIYDVKYIRW